MNQAPTPPCIDPAMLRAGDILLMRGQGAISDLICWFGDSPYSHAAIMISSTQLVEAAVNDAHAMDLKEKLAAGAHYAFIDAYRPTDANGATLNDEARAAISHAALELVGTPYPKNTLLLLALYGALRNRIPADPFARWALREMLKEYAKDTERGMVCSQLVYEAMKRAATPPMVIVAGQVDLPFPKVDWWEVLREWLGANRLAATQDTTPHSITEEELAAAYAAYREASPNAKVSLSEALGWRVPKPASLDVMPLDLSTSPQIRLLGRLPLATTA